MRTRIRLRLVGFLGVVLGLFSVPIHAQDAVKAQPIRAKGVIAPVAPPLPGAVVAALQEARYDDAWSLSIASNRPPRPLRTALLCARSRHDPATRRTRGCLTQGSRTRSQGRAERPLGGQAPLRAGRRRAGRRPLRRGRGAGPRRGRDAAGRRPQGPARRGLPRLRPPPARARRPVTPPDPEGAYALLAQARDLAKGRDAPRPAPASRWPAPARPPGNHARAIEDFQAYLKEYPKGADRAAARFHLGEAQLPPASPAGPADLDRPGPRPRRRPGRPKDADDAPRPGPLRDRPHLRHPQPARRHQPEPRRRRPAAVPGRRTRRTRWPSGPPTRSARRTWPGARARRRSTALHRVPQGRGLPGRDRRGRSATWPSCR